MNWMTEKHIPDMLNTGKFTKALMSQVLVEEDMGGITYSVQYSCVSREILESYYQNEAEEMRREGFELFGNKFGAFRTELRVVREFYTPN
jgi:hypothetical protein